MNDSVIAFFNIFLEIEYITQVSQWNPKISNEEHLRTFNNYGNYFHSCATKNSLNRDIDFFNRFDEAEIDQNYSEIRKRILYMVRVYKEYELGENWSDLVEEGSLLYRFYVSSDTAYEGKELTYISDSFFAAETDEGFKIIGVAFYYDQTWWHAVWEIYQIHPGLKATEIIRLEEPIDDDSKKIYYSEEEMPIIDSPR